MVRKKHIETFTATYISTLEISHTILIKIKYIAVLLIHRLFVYLLFVYIYSSFSITDQKLG